MNIAYVWVMVALALGQVESPPETDLERAEDTVKRAKVEAERYRIAWEGEPATLLQLRDKPLLKWSNPSEGALFGSVLLWTVDGRPEAMASLYRWYGNRQEAHAEFKSLSVHPLRATRAGEASWSPEKPGLEFQVLKEEAAPGETEAARLRQMRGIARRFSATLVHPRKAANALRLLPQPLFRYEKLPKDVVDGALFSFVQATDPELLLLVEAVKGQGGLQWKYALGRMNMFALDVKLDEKEVWSVPELTWNEVIDRSQPYTIIVLEKNP